MIGLSKMQLINLDPIKDTIKQKLIEQYDATTFMNTTTVNLSIDVKQILEEFVKQKQISEPIVYITAEAYVKMRKLVDDTDTEIGWYGVVHKAPGLDRQYIIEDIIVYPQTVTGATCEQADDKMFDFEMSLTDEQVNNKRFHGHSHVNMGTTPSGVDESFYQDLLSQVQDYFIIIVTNKRKNDIVRFYDIENNILYTDLELNVLLDNGTLLDDWYDEQYKNLERYKPVVSTYGTRQAGKTFKSKNEKTIYDVLKEEDDDILTNDEYWDNLVFDEDLGWITKWEAEMATLDYRKKVQDEKRN